MSIEGVVYTDTMVLYTFTDEDIVMYNTNIDRAIAIFNQKMKNYKDITTKLHEAIANGSVTNEHLQEWNDNWYTPLSVIIGEFFPHVSEWVQKIYTILDHIQNSISKFSLTPEQIRPEDRNEKCNIIYEFNFYAPRPYIRAGIVNFNESKRLFNENQQHDKIFKQKLRLFGIDSSDWDCHLATFGMRYC